MERCLKWALQYAAKPCILNTNDMETHRRQL